MTEWAVVGVIVVLVGLIGAIIKPLLAWNANLTENTVAIKGLTDTIKGNEKSNAEEHIAIWDAVEKQCDMLNQHDKDIAVIKEKVG